MNPEISKDDLAILSTALATLQKQSERYRGRVLCADGKFRPYDKNRFLTLIDKLGVLAGYKQGELLVQGMMMADEYKRSRNAR